MTSVPPRPPIPPARGTRADTRKYSAWEWTRAYLALIALFPVYALLWFLATFVRKMPASITRKLLRAHIAYTAAHEMDFRIPPNNDVPAYMHRWWRIARNWMFNIYYHIVLRSDDDRALHDHPWWNFSIVLEGGYWEHMILAGGIHRKTWCGPGTMRFRWAGQLAHRLELDYVLTGVVEQGQTEHMELPVTTIFITGPVLRRWGFHHPDGWVDAYDWDAFCAKRGINSMNIGGGSDGVVSDRNKHNFN